MERGGKVMKRMRRRNMEDDEWGMGGVGRREEE